MPPISTSIIRNRQQIGRFHSFATHTELEQAAVQAILQATQTALGRHGCFRIVLAGGTTPRRVYELLREHDVDWSAWHVYFGDERCLPRDHAERNSRMAAQAWLDHVQIPPDQIHIIPAEDGADHAASQYAQTLARVDMFDMVLLGLGEDGHTASLFPGHAWGDAPTAPDVLAVSGAPKPPAQRVSLSANRLGKAHTVIFLVTGEAKQQAINSWRNGSVIPAAIIAPANGVDIYLEAALLKNLPSPDVTQQNFTK